MEKRELLEERTVEELKQMAREKNLSGYSNLRKAELMDIIEANYARSEIESWPESGLSQAIEEARAKIIVAGCGGAGGNTVTRITEAGIGGAETVAINTDAQDLLHTFADEKILIGREATGGLGAGNDPEKGKKAAEESKDLLKEHLYGADMVFVTCGLGGGTGTGASPLITEIAGRLGALTAGVVTLPFNVEGRLRNMNAKRGLDRLLEAADATMIIPDENISKTASDLPIGAAFRVADEILMKTISGITELVSEPGLINLDFADIETILQDAGTTQIGIGESGGENRSLKAAEEALESPLLDADVSEAEKALINATGDSGMTLEEARTVTDKIAGETMPEADVLWGARISDELKDEIRVMIMIPNVDTPWSRGPIIARREEVKERLDSELKPARGEKGTQKSGKTADGNSQTNVSDP